MPMHDWRKIEAGLYHSFHASWLTRLNDALNDGLLPENFYAATEQVITRYNADILTLSTRDGERISSSRLKETMPVATLIDEGHVAKPRATRNRIAIHHVSGDKIIAVIEIVSPANKDTKRDCDQFIEKAAELLETEINLLLIDPFKSTKQAPHGLHTRIWQNLFPDTEPHATTDLQPLMNVTYTCLSDGDIQAGIVRYSLGELIPAISMLIDLEWITIPLEGTYMQAWDKFPTLLKERYFG